MTDRKSAFALTPDEQTRYINTIKALNTGQQPTLYAQFVGIHADMSHLMHSSMGGGAIGRERFLPWHRDFLAKFEAAMKAIDPLAFIPYWQWSANRRIPPWISAFKPTVMLPASQMAPPTQVKVTRSPHVAAALPTVGQINSLENDTSLPYTQFTSLLEGYHNTVHSWVGGTMNNIMVSPADPLFWMHHGEIDRIWNVWQSAAGNATKGPTLSPAHAILDPWAPDNIATVAKISALNYRYV